MFIAMMVYPEFLKKHMNLFIAMAPVLYCKNIKAYNKGVHILESDEDAREMLKSLGPELFEDTAGFHPLVNNFSSVWEFGQELSVQYVSDAKP